MATEIFVPDIGDFSDVEIIEVLVTPGDHVNQEDSLITVESDKASMEIPSTHSGVVSSVLVSAGDKVSKGSLILTLETDRGAAEVPAEKEEIPQQQPEVVTLPVDEAPVTSEPAEPATTATLELRVPDIGDFEDVEVIEVLVSAGDSVTKEQSLLTLESDKAAMEIPASHAGTIESIAVAVGDRVSKGDLIAALKTSGTVTKSSTPAVKETSQSPSAALAPGDTVLKPDPVEPSPPGRITHGNAHASPAIRQFARELGVNVSTVIGTGRKGRITKEDVQNHVKSRIAQSEGAKSASGLSLPVAPAIDFTKWGDIETVELGRIKKLSGAHLHRSWLSVPHVTQFDEADITELETFRKESKPRAEKEGVKLTFMPFLMKACATALKSMPEFNASLTPDGESLILKKYVNIGVAVDTPKGLVVPVVKNVDKKGIFELASELMELSLKARDGKLSPSDMQGGCFSISSLGGIGGTQFTPIVNAPEVAILGVSKAEMKPKWDGKEFQPRLIMPFSLSYDHRVIDGAQGVRFTTVLGDLLDDIRHLLL